MDLLPCIRQVYTNIVQHCQSLILGFTLQKHGPIVGATLGGFPFVSIKDYETAKKYFMKDDLSGRPTNAAVTSLGKT